MFIIITLPYPRERISLGILRRSSRRPLLLLTIFFSAALCYEPPLNIYSSRMLLTSINGVIQRGHLLVR